MKLPNDIPEVTISIFFRLRRCLRWESKKLITTAPNQEQAELIADFARDLLVFIGASDIEVDIL